MQRKVELEQQVQQEKARVNLLRKQALSATGAKRGKGGKRVQLPTVTTASAIIQQLTSPVATETLLPQQMLASQQMQEALKVLQQDQTTRYNCSF